MNLELGPVVPKLNMNYGETSGRPHCDRQVRWGQRLVDLLYCVLLFDYCMFPFFKGLRIDSP